MFWIFFADVGLGEAIHMLIEEHRTTRLSLWPNLRADYLKREVEQE